MKKKLFVEDLNAKTMESRWNGKGYDAKKIRLVTIIMSEDRQRSVLLASLNVSNSITKIS